MLRILDRYILRKFLGTYFLMLVIIMMVAVVFDISEKTEDFAKMKASVGEIVVDYYLNFILYYANLFSGLFIFLAVLLFTSRLAHRSEIIAMLSNGVSFPRVLWPYFVGATFLCVLSLVVNHQVLPAANRVRLAFEEAHIRATFFVEDRHLHREITPGVIAYCEHYGAKEKTLYHFGLEQWDGHVLVRKLNADRAVYDSVNGSWHLHDYLTRIIGADGDRFVRGAEMDTVIALKPSDLGQRWETAMAMSTGELDDYIDAKRKQGDGKVTSYLIERHQRTSYPFATYVFTLIGVSIASRKVRGGTGLHLALGVMLVLIYVFTMKLTTVAATNAGLEPFLAVWAPNVLFGAIGIWIYRKAPK
ncbi:MAG: LptF/LptG family permease [Flavobacteriales bacterium]|nr:LptF/LptG family permease [Flavobacteriales bacterium]MCC6937256.1 LptF/LptG family permease [Flavobacteriales bacterium]